MARVTAFRAALAEDSTGIHHVDLLRGLVWRKTKVLEGLSPQPLSHKPPLLILFPQKSAEQPHTRTHCPARTEHTAQLRSYLRVWLFFISTAGEGTGGVSCPSDLSSLLTLSCISTLYTLCHTHIIFLFLYTLLLFFICSTHTRCWDRVVCTLYSILRLSLHFLLISLVPLYSYLWTHTL